MQIPDRWADVQWCIDHDIEAVRFLDFKNILSFSDATLQRIQRIWDASEVRYPAFANPNVVVAAILLAIDAGKLKRQLRSYSRGATTFSREVLTGKATLDRIKINPVAKMSGEDNA